MPSADTGKCREFMRLYGQEPLVAPFAPSSDALVTTSKALVTTSFLLLLVRHLLLVAMHLLLVASCS